MWKPRPREGTQAGRLNHMGNPPRLSPARHEASNTANRSPSCPRLPFTHTDLIDGGGTHQGLGRPKERRKPPREFTPALTPARHEACHTANQVYHHLAPQPPPGFTKPCPQPSAEKRRERVPGEQLTLSRAYQVPSSRGHLSAFGRISLADIQALFDETPSLLVVSGSLIKDIERCLRLQAVGHMA